ncbi:MAG: ankyrin repeat domain-containing protein [Akkermansia sp.]|nr:ankyrin repeat domain-containing protein [Akkermansia sp.]
MKYACILPLAAIMLCSCQSVDKLTPDQAREKLKATHKITDVEMKDDQGRTALMAAAANGNTDLVKLLVKAGANVNAKASGQNAEMQMRDYTPLMVAVGRSNLAATQALLAAGADVNAKAVTVSGKTTMNGVTPLFVATANNDAGCVKALLGAGANAAAKVSVAGSGEMTALDLATAAKNAELIMLLSAAMPD